MKIAFLLICTAFAASAAPCGSLSSLKLTNTVITIAEERPAGPFTAPAGGRPIPGLPAFCRVAGSIRPTADSDIQFEVWMPASGWNGKFQGVGNGGFAGTISYAGLADAVAHGYATASTDTGHRATSANPNAEWALKHPEKIVDFGYRAIHETAVAAKQVIAGFYGEGPKHSYFNSCSTGGRQALMEAERFPADYDGIVAGAPANYWTHLISAAALGVKAMLSEAASYIPAVKLPAIEAAALAQCDAIDGVKDGVIENPMACRFDPAVLRCRGAESDACLTEPQLKALETVYGGLKDSRGRQLFPGLSPGAEGEPGGWGPWVTGTAPKESQMYYFSTQFFQNMVYDDPAWRFQSFDTDRDTKAADEKLASVLNSTNPDLSAFQKAGGKLILYHGWADAAIPALNTVDFYNSVNAKMGAANAESLLRLYMVPGMGHCGGGPGPNQFGQASVPHADAQHDIDAALEAWVEKGEAPAAIVASKAEKGKVVRTRPLCPWPAVAKWDGKGNTDDAASFSCSAP
jgi:feruloyl esterase